jgi:U3 small nucleolar RNA-associated protein 12
VWGLDFGDCHKSFLAHADSVTSVAFLSRTHYFFSAGKDRLIKYWDADRFEHILTLEGHKGEVWGVATAPDGAFLVSGSHDRSLRMWVRTDEQVCAAGFYVTMVAHPYYVVVVTCSLKVFLDEEREREFDGLLNRQLRDADDSAEAALGGDDAVGPIGPSGFAVPTGMDALVPTAQPITGGGAAGGDAATSLIARASHDSMHSADRLLEALSLVAEETKRWSEFADDVAAAEAAGEANPLSVVGTPPRNALLLGLTPSAYLLRVVRNVRPADLDQVLLVLPFTNALDLLRHTRHWLEGGQATELLARCCLLLLRIHHRALIANQTLQPLLGGLKAALQGRVAELKDCIGVNIAALRFFDAALADITAVMPTVVGKNSGEEEGVRIGKRRRVKLF